MKKLLVALGIVFILVAGAFYATSAEVDFPVLKDGDLIFQTSTGSQSSAIFVATGNSFTHMGIIKQNPDGLVVVEASSTVKETPLRSWVNRGLLNRVAVYRHASLAKNDARVILAAAKELYGQPYDIFFSFDNGAIYCSELPYLAYVKAGIVIGKVQKISELNFDNMVVRKIIKQRWQRHPECKAKGYNFDQCFNHLLNQDLVTPASIAGDKKFELVFSNYPL
jgi:Permuted papain-like amidase enzyme, YaeF/YiiX, C92 family